MGVVEACVGGLWVRRAQEDMRSTACERDEYGTWSKSAYEVRSVYETSPEYGVRVHTKYSVSTSAYVRVQV